MLERFPYCSMMASFSEGLVLGEKVGLDPETIVQVNVAIVMQSICPVVSLLATCSICPWYDIVIDFHVSMCLA